MCELLSNINTKQPHNAPSRLSSMMTHEPLAAWPSYWAFYSQLISFNLQNNTETFRIFSWLLWTILDGPMPATIVRRPTQPPRTSRPPLLTNWFPRGSNSIAITCTWCAHHHAPVYRVADSLYTFWLAWYICFREIIFVCLYTFWLAWYICFVEINFVCLYTYWLAWH